MQHDTHGHIIFIQHLQGFEQHLLQLRQSSQSNLGGQVILSKEYIIIIFKYLILYNNLIK